VWPEPAGLRCAQVDGAVSMLEPDMPIKRLLMLLEMAQHSGKAEGVQSNGRIALTRWVECIQDLHG
jgi:vesicle-fusing ATPase